MRSAWVSSETTRARAVSRLMRGELSEVWHSEDRELTRRIVQKRHKVYGRVVSETQAAFLVILSDPLPEHHANRLADAIRLLYGVSEVTYVPHDVQQAIANETALVRLRGQLTDVLWPEHAK